MTRPEIEKLAAVAAYINSVWDSIGIKASKENVLEEATTFIKEYPEQASKIAAKIIARNPRTAENKSVPVPERKASRRIENLEKELKTNQMAQKANLTEKVSNFATREVKADLNELVKAHKFELNDKDIVDTEHSPETRCIIVPETMNKLQAAHNLIKQFEEEETYRTFDRAYPNFFLNDFIVVIQKLIPKYFGMLHVSPIATNGYPAAKRYIQIPVGFDDETGKVKNEQGYIGSIIAPVWQDAILDIFPGKIIVKAKMKFEEDVNAFLADVEDSIRRHSIVKGNSVSITITGDGIIAQPIQAKENKKIVLEENVHRIINNLVIPSLKEKGKASLLFTGDYGTGKTETAIKVGIAAQRRHGRTFFYLENSEKFTALIPYIKNYQGACVFVEDVDQISSGDRDSAMNDLLNHLDGNELKRIDCVFIFTTNNDKKIHPAMRRPGRIDQIVHFGYCTPPMIEEIFKLWAESVNTADGWSISEDMDYKKAAAECPENLQGAVVAEIAKRALGYAEHLNSKVISTERFLDAVASMKNHIEFMRGDQQKDHTAENLLGHIFFKAMQKAFPKLGTGEPVSDGRPLPDFMESPYLGLNN
jgi:SpoVK/Ycf46/Vps4 family AAA+-type ATPase